MRILSKSAFLFTAFIFIPLFLYGQEFKTIKEVWTTPFKSQGETGTCWCFSTTSFLESEAHRLGKGDFELSQMYTVYNEYIEKSLRHIRSHKIYPFREGGLAHDVIYIIKKYGSVPRNQYTGYQNDALEYDHTKLVNDLSGILKELSGSEKPIEGEWIEGQFKFNWMRDFKTVLDNNLGVPPQSFEFNGRNYTPAKFASEQLNLPLDDYIEITSYSMFPFYTADEMPLPDNWLHYNKFYNVPLDDFMRIIDSALDKGFSLVADLHVTGKELRSTQNYLLGLDEEKDIPVTQKERDTMLETWRTEDIHLEHITGTAVNETGKKFYKAKDSIGSEGGNGPLYNKEYLSEDFVKSRVLSIMVHKDAVPEDILIKLGIR